MGLKCSNQDGGLKLGQNGRDSEVSLCVSGALERGLGVHLWDALTLLVHKE